MIHYIVEVACVVGIAIGQILFKVSATWAQQDDSFFSPRALATLATAFGLYGLTSLAWIWALQHIDLGRAYPLMALAFVLVPLGSHVFLGEHFRRQYFFGVIIMIIGIIITTNA